MDQKTPTKGAANDTSPTLDELSKKLENISLNDEVNGACSSIKSKFDYVIIDNEEKLKDSIKDIRESLQEESTLAVDCEGDSLSRKGTLQLLSVSTRKQTFLFDIVALKISPFELGLREILESKDVKKLMFDCREDSDALFHQHQVKLDGVLDIQLLEVIKRPPKLSASKSGRRSERHDEVVDLKGLLICFQEYLQDKEIVEIKRKVSRRMNDWGKRPLDKELSEYATVDVLGLFQLFDKFQPDHEEIRRLEIASDIYVDLKRSIANRTYDEYEHNGYLPIDVVPERGCTNFAYGYINCRKCKRRFPRDEFSKTQLKNGNQLCRTCKKVKLDIDNARNRELHYERHALRRKYYDDSDSDYGYDLVGYNYDSDEYYYWDSD